MPSIYGPTSGNIRVCAVCRLSRSESYACQGERSGPNFQINADTHIVRIRSARESDEKDYSNDDYANAAHAALKAILWWLIGGAGGFSAKKSINNVFETIARVLRLMDLGSATVATDFCFSLYGLSAKRTFLLIHMIIYP